MPTEITQDNFTTFSSSSLIYKKEKANQIINLLLVLHTL